MRKLIIFILALLFGISMFIPISDAFEFFVLNPWPSSNGTLTVGNHSYIPINCNCGSSEQVPLILGLLKDFEDKNFRLHVLSFTVEKDQSTHNTIKWLYGIWITHEPREPKK